MLLDLDLKRVVLGLDPEDADALKTAQIKVLSGEDPWFAHNFELVISKYAHSLGLEARFSWDQLTVALEEGGQSKILKFSDHDNTWETEWLTPRQYLFIRALFCWLSTLLVVKYRGKKPSLFLYDRTETLSFTWKLSSEQSKALQGFFGSTEMDSEVSVAVDLYSQLLELSFASGHLLRFDDKGLVNTHVRLVHFNGEEFTSEELPTALGLLCLGFLCRLVDIAEAHA